jgi:transposase
MDVFCGIDWAEAHHDIALVNQDGQLLARRRISDDAAGLAALLGLTPTVRGSDRVAHYGHIWKGGLGVAALGAV